MFNKISNLDYQGPMRQRPRRFPGRALAVSLTTLQSGQETDVRKGVAGAGRVLAQDHIPHVFR